MAWSCHTIYYVYETLIPYHEKVLLEATICESFARLSKIIFLLRNEKGACQAGEKWPNLRSICLTRQRDKFLA